MKCPVCKTGLLELEGTGRITYGIKKLKPNNGVVTTKRKSVHEINDIVRIYCTSCDLDLHDGTESVCGTYTDDPIEKLNLIINNGGD